MGNRVNSGSPKFGAGEFSQHFGNNQTDNSLTINLGSVFKIKNEPGEKQNGGNGEIKIKIPIEKGQSEKVKMYVRDGLTSYKERRESSR